MRLTAPLLAVLSFMLAFGCDRPPPVTPVVIVSVLPQAYFVQRVAGDLVDVHVMIPPGASPVTYNPSLEQIRAATDASLYVKVGHPSFPFERAWLDRLVGAETRVVDASAGLQRRDGDPHVWVSPSCARTMAANITAALVEILPSHASTFEANLKSLNADIDALDAEIRAMLEPHQGKTFFVAHPAWGYFADEYGLVQASIELDGKSPPLRYLMTLSEAARESGAKAILVQPQFSKRSAETLAEMSGLTIVEADPLAADWLQGTRHVAKTLAEVLAP